MPDEIFFICSVRGASDVEKEKQKKYRDDLKSAGHDIHWPHEDTPQDKDPIGLQICRINTKASIRRRKTHIRWDPKSEGSKFDFGAAFAMLMLGEMLENGEISLFDLVELLKEREITVTNPEDIEKIYIPAENKIGITKSYNKMVYELTKKSHHLAIAREERYKANCRKGQNGAVLVKNGKIISRGHDSCEPKGSSRKRKIKSCPSMEKSPNSAPELCRSLHAEIMACLNIRFKRNLDEYILCESHREPTKPLIQKLYTRKEMEKLNGSTLIISGSKPLCRNCEKHLLLCGVVEIKADPLFFGPMEKHYED